ncbi:hypothetical protein LTR94_030771, partial [Friedmanniomyces endolithicus]
MGNIRQNLVFAFGYNALGIPVAAGLSYPVFGWLLSPALAALAMALSSVSVIGNALRLRAAINSPPTHLREEPAVTGRIDLDADRSLQAFAAAGDDELKFLKRIRTMSHQQMDHGGQGNARGLGPYRSLYLELALDFVIMYLVMYTMIATLGHFYLNLNNVYMTLMMVAPMAVLMLVFMR